MKNFHIIGSEFAILVEGKAFYKYIVHREASRSGNYHYFFCIEITTGEVKETDVCIHICSRDITSPMNPAFCSWVVNEFLNF